MNTTSNYKTESIPNIYPAQITLNHNARKREVDRINRENMVSTIDKLRSFLLEYAKSLTGSETDNLTPERLVNAHENTRKTEVKSCQIP